MRAVRCVTAILILAPAASLAQLGPDIGEPDPKIATVAFNNGTAKGVTGASAEVSAKATAFQLSGGAQVPGAEPGTVCRYDMTVMSVNYGPGLLSAEDVAKLVVGVRARLPDGSDVVSQGKLCFQDSQAPYQPGTGCTGTDTVFLPAGETVLTWTLDPSGQVAQDYEEGNIYRIVVKVPSPCLPQGEIALAKQPDASAPPPRRGIEAAHERLSQGLNFTRGVKPSSTPSGRSPRSKSPSPANPRLPPQ